MKLEQLIDVLQKSHGIEKNKDLYKVPEALRLSLYIGQPGQAMVINEVESLSISDLIYAQCADQTHWYIELEAIHAVCVRRLEENKARRAGFGS